MKLIAIFGICFLVGRAVAAPTSDDDKVVIDDDFFPEKLVIYTGEHDIVNILVPLNNLNFADDDDVEDGSESNVLLFFTEAEKDADGNRVDKGLYVLKNKNATKLLDHGREAAADIDDSNTAYFAAKDGIYKYNAAENKAEKYGSVDDSIISIAKVNGTDLIYILTEDHVLYKVTEEGSKKEKVTEVNNAQQIVLDLRGNLYFSNANKEVFVFNSEGVQKIEGLKVNASTVDLLKPFVVFESGIPVVLDKDSYIVYPNGTSEAGDFEVKSKPTAYGMEATLIQYFGYNKKIYEYNVIVLLMEDNMLNELRSYLSDKTDTIQDLSTKNRVELRSGGL